MPKKKRGEENQIITIQDSSIDVKKIVRRIKDEIKKKKVAYLKELEKNLPGVIDTAENSEFLLEGWYENESIGGYRARWTKKEFSFLFNPFDSDTLALQIIATPPKVKQKPLKASLYLGREKKGEIIIAKPGEQIVRFRIPRKYQSKNLTAKIKLSRVFTPVQEKQGMDIRKLGLAIKKISNLPYTEIGSKYIPKLTEFEYQAPLELEKIKYHINPENLLPQKTRLKFFKKLILKTIKVFTSIQIGFNTYTQEFLKKLTAYLVNLSSYIKSLDSRIAQTQKSLDSKIGKTQKEIEKIKPYQPIYWEKEKDKFYVFHQNFFRGSFSDIKERLKIYLAYLNKPNFYKSHPFVDFGCGRGEFLELLKEKNINSLGVDTNKKYKRIYQKKQIKFSNSDALNFLKKYQDKLGGASAFHLIEHLEFPQLFDFLKLIYKKLKRGSVLILETPNPENLTVGSWQFHYDYTHQKPIPPLLLLKTLEFIGYKNIKILKLHPEKTTKTQSQKRIFGPRDYAVISWK